MTSKLVVLTFEGEGAAEGMLDTVKELEQRGAIELEDMILLSRASHGEQVVIGATGVTPGGATTLRTDDPEIKQSTYRRGRAAAKGAGIGVLAGWLVGGPIGGAAIGALIGGLRDRGIDDKFAQQIAGQLHSDSSALMLLVKRADPEAVREAIKPHQGTLLHSDLSPEAEKELRKAMSREE